MSDKRLKPCPACGSDFVDCKSNKLWQHDFDAIWSAGCLNCGCHGSICDNEEEAVENWNELPRQSDIERLEKEVNWLAAKLGEWECPKEECYFFTDKCENCWRIEAEKFLESK